MGQSFDFEKFSQKCRQICSPEILLPSVRLTGLHRECEQLLEMHQTERNRLLDCKAGCGSCCIVNVSVLFPEVLAILEFLEDRAADDIEHLVPMLDEVWVRIRGLDDDERICLHQPCVFLDSHDGCSIYPVRPLLCRGVTSTDAESCRQSFVGGLQNDSSTVLMNLFQRELYDAAYLGVSAGLEAQGLDGRGYELTGLVRFLMRNPQKRDEMTSGLQLQWDDLA